MQHVGRFHQPPPRAAHYGSVTPGASPRPLGHGHHVGHPWGHAQPQATATTSTVTTCRVSQDGVGFSVATGQGRNELQEWVQSTWVAVTTGPGASVTAVRQGTGARVPLDKY